MTTEIVDELAELASTAPEFTPRPLKDPSNKGLVRSAFQKAMRRGQTDRALSMGELLVDADAGNAWKSMAVVVVEDIGIGDLDLLAYSTITTLKAEREAFDGEAGANRLFAAMIQRACVSEKSRSCCELALGADKGEGALFEDFRGFKDDTLKLTQIMAGGDAIPAYVAASVLRKSLRGLGQDALMLPLQTIMETLSDEREARACMMSFERTVDDMNVALFPIVHVLNRDDDEITVFEEEPTWPEETVIKSVSSAAFDMHTGTGARAIKALWNQTKETCEWMRDAEKDPPFEEWSPIKTLGSLIFIVEGGLLDRRLMSPNLQWMKRYQDMNFAKGYGVPAVVVDQAFDELLEFVTELIPKLNELRAWSAKK